MVRISEIEDNFGRKQKVYSNLNIGDKLKSKETIVSKDDLGASGLVFDYNSFIKDKIYEVVYIGRCDYVNIAYVSDESGTLDVATPDLFDVILT